MATKIQQTGCLWVVSSHWKWYHLTDCVWLSITLPQELYSYLVLFTYFTCIRNPNGVNHSLSSRHTLPEHSHVHNRTPVFSRGCLLPRIGRTDVQWSQIWFNSSKPYVVGPSWRSFLVWCRLANRSSNCMVTVFIRSTGCNTAKESQVSFHYHVGKWETPDTALSSGLSCFPNRQMSRPLLLVHLPSGLLTIMTSWTHCILSTAKPLPSPINLIQNLTS